MKKLPRRYPPAANAELAKPALPYAKQMFFAVALLLGALIAYSPALWGEMVWDDSAHVTHPEMRSLGGLQRMWFELDATQQYYPILHSAFWIQQWLWGDETFGYHIVNVLLHVISAMLLYLILTRLQIPGAYLAAVIFALHPVHVESVAWISELKNTLSGALYLGAALAYLHFDERRSKGLYALALLLFVFALMSKSVTATMPAALLVVFWWQRGRLDWRRDVLPLAPFFAVGVAGGLFTALVETTYIIGAHGSREFQFSFVERCLIAGRVVWFYLSKLLWPTDLMFFYPRWEIDASAGWQYLFPLGAIALLAALWRLRQRTRAPLAAILLFGGTLFPVLGFFNVYPFRISFVADHFQYLASLPIIALFAAGLALLLKHYRLNVAPVLIGVAGLSAGALGILTHDQCGQYKDEATLYAETIRRNPKCWVALNNLGQLYKRLGNPENALRCYRKALKIKPDCADTHYNLGVVLSAGGQVDEAIQAFKDALSFDPQLAGAQYFWGITLQNAGRPEEAIEHYRAALEINPRYPEAYMNLGVALQNLHRPTEAIEYFKKTLQLQPDYWKAHYNLGNALRELGSLDEALTHYDQALRSNPDFAQTYYNRGLARYRAGCIDDAIDDYRQAVRILPAFPEAEFEWAAALTKQDRYREAVEHLDRALQYKPDYSAARDLLVEAKARQTSRTKSTP